MTIELAPGWEIPDSQLSLSTVTSSGPGGQNVNKVSTKVVLRFSFGQSEVLSSDQKARLRAQYPSHVTRQGELLVTCDETRSQEANKQRATARLVAMLNSIRHPPRIRKKTRPSRSQKRRRLEQKRARGELKKSRRVRVD